MQPMLKIKFDFWCTKEVQTVEYIFLSLYVTWSDKKGLIARQILTIISRFEIL